MKRKEIIFNKLIELFDGNGVSTIELANELKLNRANVSNDLNELCEAGKIEKKKGKPVRFYPIMDKLLLGKQKISKINKFDTFVSRNKSLYSAIEQAKAAVLYPPKGMNMMILGETGVGKSMFVSLIYDYAVEMNILNRKSPFITFNCADYANNPQLLLAQLFGSKKGAYTGADKDKEGLIDKANNGILFLDEVHRLPSEGQEMLFTFIDKGIFRKLGETEAEHRAKVLIICATTENPNESLLKTFTRRIPMIINIPSLNERTIEERFELISEFMKEESARLGKKIKVSTNSIKALLSYNCLSNIGQLRGDIQLICARAYSEFLSRKKNEIIINSLDLPIHIRKGLYKELEHRQLWNRLIDINKKYCIFSIESNDVIFEEYKDDIDIYKLLDLRYRELKSRGINQEGLRQCINSDIDNYFKKYLNRLDKNFNCDFEIEKLENIIQKEILSIIIEIIEFCGESLERALSQKVCYGMAIHINNAIERVRANKKNINPELNSIRVDHKKEFNIGLDCLKIIDRALDISMPIDEAGFLAMFLTYDNKNIDFIKNEVKVIVIAHGESTATSMADTANKLLGYEYAIGINAPLCEKVEFALVKLKEVIKENNINSEIILLVDMGSLTTFKGEIEKEFNIKVRAVNLVSTLHVIEATRKAMMGYSVDEIREELLKVNEMFDKEENAQEIRIESSKKLAVLSICTTGDGGAKTVKQRLDTKLKYDKDIMEIITLKLVNENIILEEINILKEKYEIISIVSTFNIDININQLTLEDIFVGQGIDNLQRKIDIETAYIKMGETLETHLKHINKKCVLNDIKCFNNNIQEKLGINIQTNRLIGITLHIACMIDRINEEEEVEEFTGKAEFIEKNKDLYELINSELKNLLKKYYEDFNINDDEVCYLMSFFKQNIF